MPENLAFPFFLVVALIVVGWFALGTQSNVRAGDRVLKWLRDGLPLIGEKTTLHWMGSSVMQLKIAKGKDPFRVAETLIVFEPRDVVFLWLLARAQGRRDLMIFRGTLNTAPSFELEVFDPQGWTTHHTERDMQNKKWTRSDVPNAPTLHSYYSGSAGANAVQSLTDIALRAGGKLVRLSVHRDLPNIEAHWLLPDVKSDSAHKLFSSLRQIGEQVTRG